MPPATRPVRRRAALAVALALALLAPARAADGEGGSITLASTTSTEQSGLFAWLLPRFREASGVEVRVVAVGTGQALEMGRRGDADALLVHDRPGEDRLAAEGHAADRRDVMYNDYVLVGPAADPAGVKGMDDAAAALARVAAARAPFASRGDDSGTHRAELRLWRQAGVDPGASVGGGGASWYRELGQGMGPTLNAAAGMEAYALTDRATWASFKNRRGLAVLVEGDPALFNQYGSLLVDPARHPGVRAAPARLWHEWLTGEAGQRAIAEYRIDGQQVFFPNAPKGGS